MEDRPWPEYGRGRKPITVVQIARLLKKHAISPSSVRMNADHIPRGYRLDQFKNAFARYLLPFEPPHRHNPQKPAENRPFQGATLGSDVADEKTLKPTASMVCGGVADENPVSGDERLFRALESLDDDPEERAAIQEWDG